MRSRKKEVPQALDYPEVMNQAQVASLLGLSRRCVQEYTKKGTIPHRKLGRRRLYSKTRIFQWLEKESRTTEEI
ncbi:MAG: helix-turn-helix domain-containing protein [Planctomycetia bacterium]|nr:helix-turn-helix domain-containing protein [Planctomycetia bacterium]